MQWPHEDSEARSGGKKKRNNNSKFKRSIKETNIMEHDAPIPKEQAKTQE